MTTYKNYKIKKSGKHLFKVYQNGQSCAWQRFTSIEAAKAVIDANSEHRVMTPAEHALVYAK